MLLLHPDIRKTMTEKDVELENKSGCLSQQNLNLNVVNISSPTMDTTIFETSNLQDSNSNEKAIDAINNTKNLQFQGAIASNCLKRLVHEHDFEKAREQIIEDKMDGEVLRERIFKLPRTTAARLIINGKTHTLGADLRDFVKQNQIIKKEEAEKKRLNGIEVYKKDKKEQDEALEKNKDKDNLMSWTVSDLKAVIKLEKSKEDGAMPSKKGLG
jgi:hypothetical protein